jgi:flagellar motility protein MotE (MotC chaperone)
MKKIVLMGLVVAVLFAVSAAASWMMRNDQTAHHDHEESPDMASESGAKAAPSSNHNQGSATSSNGDARPAVRPNINAEAETAAHLTVTLRNQIEAVKTREQQLNTRQKQLELIYLDIRSERAALDDIRKQINEEAKIANDKLESLERKAGDVDKKHKQVHDKAEELKDSYRKIDDSEKDNLKRMANMYDSMEADAAAQTLQQMADSGKLDTAAKILFMMRERQAAKVLAQFPDRTTVAQLMEQMRKMQRPPGPNLTAPPTPSP